ncbi:MAG: hypothetical protein ETSY2_31095 [Candidatus Entotheonella gemina]|uniref:Uncharacterized protein n=1 Tax=Candidatus Entotheonella gemina TaxID=1429439 RepID=W4M256_9BACT|nr:MAG: hypothetical protein ETSY2_31095 [Candidatus Entotheonella gemina]
MWRFYSILIALLLSPAALLAEPVNLAPEALQARLEQANQAFQQALDTTDTESAQGYYQQAIDAYTQLIDAGVHNAKLYYNLGNAHILRNDFGRAILNYRRGLQLEPGNSRLQANLRYARSQRLDQIETSAQQASCPASSFGKTISTCKRKSSSPSYFSGWPGPAPSRTAFGAGAPGSGSPVAPPLPRFSLPVPPG